MIDNDHYKFWLTINQKAYIDNGIKISFELAGLMSYLSGLCFNDNSKLEEQRLDGFTWMNYKKLLKDMPLLSGRSGASVTNKIKRLEFLGLIETKKVQINGRPRKYIKITTLGNNIMNGFLADINQEICALLVSMGMNEAQAMEISDDEDFLKNNIAMIKRTARSNRIYNKAAYIWGRYNKNLLP